MLKSITSETQALNATKGLCIKDIKLEKLQMGVFMTFIFTDDTELEIRCEGEDHTFLAVFFNFYSPDRKIIHSDIL